MFHTRFITFGVLLFLLFSLHARGAHEETGSSAGKAQIMVFTESVPSVREIHRLEMQTAIPSGNEARDQHARAGGRKLKIRKTLSHRGEASKVTTSCSRVDSAAAAVERKVVACQSSQLVRGKPGTFVPFSADYHVPRPHPPKNN